MRKPVIVRLFSFVLHGKLVSAEHHVSLRPRSSPPFIFFGLLFCILRALRSLTPLDGVDETNRTCSACGPLYQVAITFMEKPYIDFKFQLGKLNVMAIGPGDMNVGALVSSTIKNIVTGLMVFPVKMVIPILGDDIVNDILVSWRAVPLDVCAVCAVCARVCVCSLTSIARYPVDK